jgi:RHS repeat-associated protein
LSTFYEDGTRRPDRTVVDTETSKPQQSDLNYTYNPAGLVTSIADKPLDRTPDVQCFRYDHLQRLTSAWTPAQAPDSCKADPSAGNLAGPAQYWQSFAYDKVGNRLTDTQHTAQGDAVRTYGKGDAHKMKSVSTAKPGFAAAAVDEPTYDAAGNTINRKTSSGATQKLDWDPEGRLAKVTEAGKVTEFVYGATGERLIRRDPGGTTVYLTGQELRVAGTVKTATRYYSHGGQVVASRSGDKLNYVATDLQGTMNTSVEVREPGTELKTERRRQLPFGGPRGPQGNFAGDRGFVSGTVDSSASFVTLGIRQYDPDTGRFLSVDPIGDISDPQQLHGYSYASNSPITKSDPTGLLATPCLNDGLCANPNTGALPGGSGNSTTPSGVSTPAPSYPNNPPVYRPKVSPQTVSRRDQAETGIAPNALNYVIDDLCHGRPGKAFDNDNLECARQYGEVLRKQAYRQNIEPARPKRDDASLLDMIQRVSDAAYVPGHTVSACGGPEVFAGASLAGEVCIAKDQYGWGWSMSGKFGEIEFPPNLGYGVAGGIKVSQGTIEDLGGHGKWAAGSVGNVNVELSKGDSGLYSLSVGGGLDRAIIESNMSVSHGDEWAISGRFTPQMMKDQCLAFGVCGPGMK